MESLNSRASFFIGQSVASIVLWPIKTTSLAHLSLPLNFHVFSPNKNKPKNLFGIRNSNFADAIDKLMTNLRENALCYPHGK